MNEGQCDKLTKSASEKADDENYKERLAAWKGAQFSPPPEPPLSPLQPALIENVSMRDGVRLVTEIFLPSGAETSVTAFPVILCRSPYPYSIFSRSGGKGNIPKYLAAGYAVVFQLTRGQGQSEGQFRQYLMTLTMVTIPSNGSPNRLGVMVGLACWVDPIAGWFSF